MGFGNEIKYCLVSLGVSQDQAAEMVGTSSKTMWNWLNDVTAMPLDKAIMLADALNIPFDRLVGRGVDKLHGNALINAIYDSLNEEWQQFLEDQALMCKLNPRFKKEGA